METEMQYENRKQGLEETIQALQNEKSSLMSEIPELIERLHVLSLEKVESSLANDVETLKRQKELLEDKIASFSGQVR